MGNVPQPLAISGSGMLLVILLTAVFRKYISYFPINIIFYLLFTACSSVFIMLLNFMDDMWKFAYFSLLCCIFALYLSALMSYENISMQSNVFFVSTALLYSY